MEKFGFVEKDFGEKIAAGIGGHPHNDKRTCVSRSQRCHFTNKQFPFQ